MDGGGAIEKEKEKGKSKVCFVSRAIWKRKHDDDDYYKGCHVFVVDLSELDDGVLELQPTIKIEFGFGDSVCGVDSTLYFAHFDHPTSTTSRNFYALDINQNTTHQSIQQQQLELDASHLRTLPLMRGKKSAALVTPIPATKKILVFSSWLRIHCWHADADYSSPHPPRDDDDDDDNDDENDDDDDDDDDDDGGNHFVDFEMYDIETNSWEKLPDLIIRLQPIVSGRPYSYFWHKSSSDKRGTPIPGFTEDSAGLRISQYTFIHNDTVFLVQLNCGLKLALNLNSPSKRWKLYDEGRVVLSTSHQNHLFVVDQGRAKRTWCASHIGGDLRAFTDLVSFPLSSFPEDEQVKQHKTFSTLTLLESDKGDGEGAYVCIVQGGVSRKSQSRHGQVIMDVMDVKAKNKPQLVASRRFEVMHHYRTFWPFCMFLYHSKN